MPRPPDSETPNPVTPDPVALNPLAPISLVIVTGFLGAGKTTRLNRWLREPGLADTLVIINEFGEVGLDHLLIEEAPGDVVLMAAGCLCCTLRGDLIATLEDLLRRRDNHRIAFFRQVLIETTGLADPLPVLQSVLQHPYLSKRFQVAGLVTLVDAANGEATLEAHPEARRQVALADTLLVTKSDLVETPVLERLAAALATLNPTSQPILDEAEFVPAALFTQRFEPWTREPWASEAWAGDGRGVLEWLGANESNTPPHPPGQNAKRHDRNYQEPDNQESDSHGAEIESFVFTAAEPISEASLIVFQEAIRILHGPRLLRLKGLVALKDDPERPMVIHHVQSVAHTPGRLARWPGRDRRTRLVFITQGIARETIAKFWEALVAAEAVPAAKP